jgi:hypothetical protein
MKTFPIERKIIVNGVKKNNSEAKKTFIGLSDVDDIDNVKELADILPGKPERDKKNER